MALKLLKHATFEDRFMTGDGPTVWQLALVPATEGLRHLGQVCVTDGTVKRWLSWNSQVQVQKEEVR